MAARTNKQSRLSIAESADHFKVVGVNKISHGFIVVVNFDQFAGFGIG